ncbi:MAG: FkbM family methyltransferase [Verrucomicrobia bacterium]|nr:FkbM family methyltransferase [Verrucomicrobiota bacterium]
MRSLLNFLLRPTRYCAVRREQVDAFAEQTRLLGDRPVRTVFDVGAFVGKTAAAYRRCFPDATIHCFEPSETTGRVLRENTRGDAKILVHALAMAERAGTAGFQCNQSAATNSLLKTAAGAERHWGAARLDTQQTVRVEATTLDEFCRAQNVDELDVLKLDIQGAELNALRGGAGLLSARKIRLIYTEVILVPTYEGQVQLDELLAWLRARGYALHNFYNFAYRGGRLLQCDAIFVPQTPTA